MLPALNGAQLRDGFWGSMTQIDAEGHAVTARESHFINAAAAALKQRNVSFAKARYYLEENLDRSTGLLALRFRER